jgi:uncharacterized protein YdhG (YjbR/CyaY superfamily)
MTPIPKTIDDYLAGLPADQRAALTSLRKAIRAVAPGAYARRLPPPAGRR